MSKNNILKGRVWLIKDNNDSYIDDIDTDMIYHNAHLAITDINEMGQYAFGNLDGWKDFPKKVKKNDIVITGGNFGAGSSRQQAVDCFTALGVSCIIAKSYGAIYKRNAINSGFPILMAPELDSFKLKNGDDVEINLLTGEIKQNGNLVGKAKPFSKVQMDIYNSGNLFEYAKSIG